MSDTPYQLYIELKKDFFTPSELITGTVHLKLLNSILIDNITLKLTKEIKVTKTRVVYSHKFNLFRPENPFKIHAGHHVYPFSFYLNTNDNASINTAINIGELVHIENNYILGADVKMHGVYMPIINTVEYINVIDNNTYENKVKKRIVFHSCLCIIKRYVKFTSQLDKVAYQSGEDVRLKIDCETKIKSVSVYLYQLVSLQDECIKTDYTMLYEDECLVGDKNVEMKIPLDSMCPSTATEVFYDVKYVIQVIVRFERRANVQYKHDVFVIKRRLKIDNHKYLSCLTGMEANMQYFVLK